MRLLNATTLNLVQFTRDIPTYAILSHTWGDQEVSFQEIELPERDKKKGFAKILGCCAQAVEDSIEWVWIDTCCTDKTSSAELSEVINSMFLWYHRAEVCYVYLEDVTFASPLLGPAFRSARWFTRGWCLQELIAPHAVEFYSADWREIGTKLSLCGIIQQTPYLEEYFSGKWARCTRATLHKRCPGLRDGKQPESRTKPTACWASSALTCLYSTAKGGGRFIDSRKRSFDNPRMPPFFSGLGTSFACCNIVNSPPAAPSGLLCLRPTLQTFSRKTPLIRVDICSTMEPSVVTYPAPCCSGILLFHINRLPNLPSRGHGVLGR